MAAPPDISAFKDRDMDGMSDAYRVTLNRFVRSVKDALTGGITTANTRNKIITLDPFLGGTTEVKVKWDTAGTPVGALLIAAIDKASKLAPAAGAVGAFRFEPPNVVLQAVNGLTAGNLYVLRIYVFAE